MLTERQFEPNDRDLLYHYCSASAFDAICRSGRIRLSDINMMNDANEVRWGYAIFESAATAFIKKDWREPIEDSVGHRFIRDVDSIVSGSQLVAHPFIACFSKRKDSLSQWRQYADDGRGYAIGFDARAIANLPCTTLEVCYDSQQQNTECERALEELFAKFPTPEHRQGSHEFLQSAVVFAVHLAALKDPTFADEEEVRSIHAIQLEETRNGVRFVDKGGFTLGGKRLAKPQKVDFYVRESCHVAYVDLPFDGVEHRCPIHVVLQGPRLSSATMNTSLFLERCGYSGVRVEKSKSGYRG